jgi:hypothetical protein
MRPMLVPTLVLLTFAFSVPDAGAQAPPIAYSIQVGGSIPNGALADEMDTGFHVLGSAEIDRGIFPRFVRAEVGFHRLQRDEEEQRYVSAGAALRIPFVEGADDGFYLVVGIGFYRTEFLRNIEGMEGQASGASVDFGANGGLGYAHRFGPIQLFGEARLHSISADRGSERIIPVSVGVRF